MKEICRSVKKKDHDQKIEGRSVYVDDYNLSANGSKILCGRLLHSIYAKAKVLSVTVPELPEGYFWVDRNDVPGDNNVNIVLDDTPVFCRDTVEYIGEPIGMVVGPDEKVVEELLKKVEVAYEELEPMLDLRNGKETFFDYRFGHGDVEKAFAEADKVYEEEFITGYQDQTYLEPQGRGGRQDVCPRLFAVPLLRPRRCRQSVGYGSRGRTYPAGCDRRRFRRQGGLSLHLRLSGRGSGEEIRSAGALCL